MTRFKDLTGLVVGRLTVLNLSGWYVAPSGQRKARWDCQCACGARKTIDSRHLVTGATTSCGCAHADAISLPDPTAAAWNSLVVIYKGGAKKRDLEWSLTDAEAVTLFRRPCSYCQTPPSNTFNPYLTKDGRTKDRGMTYERAAQASVVCNGIDRLDNALGYTATNSVPCCKICNIAKRDLPVAEFTAWLDRVAAARTNVRSAS